MPQNFFLKSIVRLPGRPHLLHAPRLAISLKGEETVETERRKFTRFLAQDQAFAVLRPHFTKLGKIKDISRGGLAFEYVAHEGQKRGSSEIDILITGDRFYLPKIPSKKIYNIKIGEENEISIDRFDRFETRRCGLQFGELTEEQAAQLNFFLKNHTTGTA